MESRARALERALERATSSNTTERVDAERAIARERSEIGYDLALVAISRASAARGTRQLALVLLKTSVKDADASANANANDDARRREREEVKRALIDDEWDECSRCRTARAMAIAAIALNDWPNEWAELTRALTGGARSRRTKNEVLGWLKTMEMIASDMDENTIESVGEELFPELLTLARTAEEEDVRRRATNAFAATMRALESLSGDAQRRARDSMIPYVGAWLDVVCAALDRVPNPRSFEQCATTMEALKSLSLAVRFFAKPMREALMPAIARGAALFHGMASVYAQYAEEEDQTTDGHASDGDEVSFESVAVELIELIIIIAEERTLNKILASSLSEMIYVVIGYMCMSSWQEEQWMDDPNQFVADEDDDFSTLRAACGLMLDSLSNRFGSSAVVALANAANRRMTESIAARIAGDQKWWRLREATLLVVGTMSDVVVSSAARAQKKGEPPPFDLASFLQTVFEVDLHESTALGAPFLRGRALWVAARVSVGVPQHMAGTVLAAAVRSLAPGLAAPLRIGACRAFAEFIPLTKPEVFAPHVRDIYTGLGMLLGESTEETLHLVLEALLVLIKADGAAAAAWLNALVPATLNIWAAHVTDPLLSADTTEIFEALAAVPACQPQLHAMLVPTLARVLASPDDQPDMLVEATLDLLTVILRPAGITEAKATHDACFRYVYALVMYRDDVGVMQGAAECMRAFLRAGNESMLEWGTGDNAVGGGDVLRAMFEAAARLLDPKLEDSASLYAAPFLCQMLRRLPTKVGPVLRDITAAVVARLRSSTQPNLSASLLTIFARIAHVDANAFINLLTSLPSGGDEPNAFHFVMRRWMEIQPDVHGAFDVKLTTSALGLLLNTQHAEMDAVAVRGCLVETESGRIRTRARAAAAGPEVWTQVPLPVKIVELLADVLLEYAESAPGAGADDADEWEDADDSADEDALDAGDDDDIDDDFPDENDDDGIHGDLFAQLLARGALGDFGPDDADQAEDPVNDVDLVAFIRAGVASLHFSGRLASLASACSPRHRRAIHDVISRQ